MTAVPVTQEMEVSLSSERTVQWGPPPPPGQDYWTEAQRPEGLGHGAGVLGVAPAPGCQPRGLVCPAPAASSCSLAPQAEALGFSGWGFWALSVMRWSVLGLPVIGAK